MSYEQLPKFGQEAPNVFKEDERKKFTIDGIEFDEDEMERIEKILN